MLLTITIFLKKKVEEMGMIVSLVPLLEVNDMLV
jgi:hypothetical protein